MVILWVLLGVAALAGADKVKLSCAGRKPGLYGNPGADCSVYYFLCSSAQGNGFGRKISCSRGTIFDKIKKRCAPADSIRGCEKFSVAPGPLTQLNPPAPVQRRTFFPRPAPQKIFRPASPPSPNFAPRPAPQPSVPRKFIPRPRPVQQSPPRHSYGAVQTPPVSIGGRKQSPVVDFECFGLPDSDYAKGCSNIYYSCLGGIAMERECPLLSLKFDQEEGACLMPDVIRDCGGTPTTPKPFVPAADPPVTKDPRCEGKASGIFEMPGQPCSGSFLSCNSGFGVEMACASNTIFDVETGKCLGQMYVQACGGKPTPTPLDDTPAELPVDPSMTCGGKADGDYEHPTIKCAYEYFSCVGGQPRARRCPSNDLRFDASIQACEEQQYVPACGGSLRPALDDTTTHAPRRPAQRVQLQGNPRRPPRRPLRLLAHLLCLQRRYAIQVQVLGTARV